MLETFNRQTDVNRPNHPEEHEENIIIQGQRVKLYLRFKNHSPDKNRVLENFRELNSDVCPVCVCVCTLNIDVVLFHNT